MASHDPNVVPMHIGDEPKPWEMPISKAYELFMGAVFERVQSGEMPQERLTPKELGEYTVWASQQQEVELPVAA